MKSGADIWKRQSLYEITWPDYGAALERLVASMRAVRYVPDEIVAIARGGLVPAIQLSHAFDIERLHILHVARCNTNDYYSAKQEPAIAWLSKPASLGARQILLVDDIAGTGATLEAAALLLEAENARVTTCVLARNEHASVAPSYCAWTVDDWVVFPWEKPVDRAQSDRTVKTLQYLQQ